MKAWLTYIKERFPLPVYALLSAGLACAPGDAPRTWFGFLYAMWLFATLRLMDELKDYHKDKVAHPERPLPRGLLKAERVSTVINALMVFGIGLSFGFAALSRVAMTLAVVTTLWLWLMYKEFYVGESLQRRPLLYAISHQLILIPMCLLMVALVGGDIASPLHFGWALGVLGAFFSYEVSRKLDPAAHPILGTYLSVYGRSGSAAIVFVLTTIAALGAAFSGFSVWMTPFAILTLFSYSILWLRPASFKVIEGLATVALFFHIWAPYLVRRFL